MYELMLSKLFRKQIKKVAKKSQPTFLNICESWESVHKLINELGKSPKSYCLTEQETFNKPTRKNGIQDTRKIQYNISDIFISKMTETQTKWRD